MRELCIGDLANHGGPESCVGVREGVGEALTGVRVGGAIEPRNHQQPLWAAAGDWVGRQFARVTRHSRARAGCPDRRAPDPEDEVTFPAPRNRPVRRVGRAPADHHLVGDEPLAAAMRACPGNTQRPPRCAGKRSAHAEARHAPGHRATDRSLHGRPASLHHRGSQAAAGWRSAPGSSTCPSAGPSVDRDAAHPLDLPLPHRDHARPSIEQIPRATLHEVPGGHGP